MNIKRINMRHYLTLTMLVTYLLSACGQNSITGENPNQVEHSNNSSDKITQAVIDTSGKFIVTRFNPPEGFRRDPADTGTFAYYLRHLPLKTHGSVVKLYNGITKPGTDVYTAVINMDIGKRDLQQCADAIMRLKAEFLYQQKRFKEIHFNLTNGFRVDYSEWIKGKRVAVKGNKTWWVDSSTPQNNYKTFREYMDFIFTYAGTLSLSKELIPVDIKDINIGDIFIYGGSPGHAVIVTDMARNEQTGEKIFLLAQSYMPAQDIQILKNQVNEDISPWYSTNFGSILQTPEWTFDSSQLMRFAE